MKMKPVIQRTSPEAKISALEAQLWVNSQPKEGDVKKKEEETPKEPAWGRNRRNPVVTHQVLGGKCKEPS